MSKLCIEKDLDDGTDSRRLGSEPDWVRAYVPGNLYFLYRHACNRSRNRHTTTDFANWPLETILLWQYWHIWPHYTYQKLKCAEQHPDWTKEQVEAAVEQFKNTTTSKPKVVVIIGAGLSGLVAAHELARAGHTMKILEAQHRVGGWMRTFADEYFFPGLWSDGKHCHDQYSILLRMYACKKIAIWHEDIVVKKIINFLPAW